MLQYSTGRGGAGNIRSPSIGGARAEEDVGSPARGREPVSQADRVTHVGRGGAGNIRSPSREPRDACESSSYNISCFLSALYFSLRRWSRCRRWGTLMHITLKGSDGLLKFDAHTPSINWRRPSAFVGHRKTWVSDHPPSLCLPRPDLIPVHSLSIHFPFSSPLPCQISPYED